LRYRCAPDRGRPARNARQERNLVALFTVRGEGRPRSQSAKLIESDGERSARAPML